MRQAQQVSDAYEHCRQVTQRASKTFYWGSVFMPPAKRQAIWAIYAFCRKVDDVVDEATEGNVPRIGHLQGSHSPVRVIDEWRMALIHLYEQGIANDDPILRAWEHVLQHYTVPLKPVLELLEGVEMDLAQTRYRTFDDLRLYCYRVAGTVGLLSTSIFGYTDERALNYAVELGIALQLTNILRDVGEDARNGRIYLPLDELERFDYRESDLMAGVINASFQNLIQFQMQRAEEYYDAAVPGIEMLNADCQLAVRLSGTLYRHILLRIRANNFDVFTMRASVPLQTKLVTASTHWFMQQLDLYNKGSHDVLRQKVAPSHYQA
ncbi:phytoene/squalene synthase family protein [Dictyobacter arantiisoli]|uniref:Phytoene desaturase n=1 Tax=Dictyobacter arantiisoli TaxID=2014874 RepID=A0A5A5T9Q9_9CHLR|nr:phytoene/squalene synthase family protein [Dictyobacter arantiisoli]GCF08152.1 phytoene desaturase [Dictyobacter arantiisoli]